MTPTPNNPGTTSTNTGGTAGRSGTDAIRDTAREAQHEAARLADQARESVRQGAASAQDEAARQANRGIERTADEVSRTSRALETAASEFKDGSLQHQLLHRAADGLEELSGTLRGRTIGEIASEIADFGRRNPAAFLGGAALAGFALARFARASREHARLSAYTSEHGSEYAERGYGRYAGVQHGRPGGSTMPQPQQPASTHTPYGAAGSPAGGPAGAGASTGSSGSVGGASAGTVGGGASAGNPTGTPPGGAGSSGVKPSTDGGSGRGTASTTSTPANKGTPNV